MTEQNQIENEENILEENVENEEILEQAIPEKKATVQEQAKPQEPTAEDMLAKLKEDYEKLRDSYLRTHAEMENVRKRARNDIENNTRYAISSFAKEMLVIADNLDRAIASVDEKFKQENEHIKNLLTGVEITAKELANIFDKNGIKRIESEGKPFDHNFQQAVQEIEDATKPAGTVVKELQSGYILNGRILREAMVVVSKGGPKPADFEKPPGAKVDTSA